MAAKRVDGAFAVLGLVFGLVFERAFLDRVAVGQLIGNQKRTGRKNHVVAVFAANAQNVVVGRAVRLVHDALVATAFELALRQRHGRTRAGDQNAVRLGGDQLERLAGNAGIGAAVALDRHHLDALGFGGLGHDVQPALAIGVAVA